MKLPVVILIGWIATLIAGVSLFLIHYEGVPYGFIVAPIGAILAAVGIAATAYANGLSKMPPAPPGTAFKLVTLSPPPTTADLLGRGISLPRESTVPDRRLACGAGHVAGDAGLEEGS